ncbi:hypothetical protein ADUPG1_011326 [Aduncisulcus paluster]|uniref:Uncharacterized protein n=1 Tax=Aduncisulcus paluster TaxID=2918883 RepID=A0ABQ5JV72_9EUKA|nr:hypothetical protein ADUPG1_011326 [Aduncisulcus paluster]
MSLHHYPSKEKRSRPTSRRSHIAPLPLENIIPIPRLSPSQSSPLMVPDFESYSPEYPHQHFIHSSTKTSPLSLLFSHTPTQTHISSRLPSDSEIVSMCNSQKRIPLSSSPLFKSKYRSDVQKQHHSARKCQSVSSRPGSQHVILPHSFQSRIKKRKFEVSKYQGSGGPYFDVSKFERKHKEEREEEKTVYLNLGLSVEDEEKQRRLEEDDSIQKLMGYEHSEFSSSESIPASSKISDDPHDTMPSSSLLLPGSSLPKLISPTIASHCFEDHTRDILRSDGILPLSSARQHQSRVPEPLRSNPNFNVDSYFNNSGEQTSSPSTSDRCDFDDSESSSVEAESPKKHMGSHCGIIPKLHNQHYGSFKRSNKDEEDEDDEQGGGVEGGGGRRGKKCADGHANDDFSIGEDGGIMVAKDEDEDEECMHGLRISHDDFFAPSTPPIGFGHSPSIPFSHSVMPSDAFCSIEERSGFEQSIKHAMELKIICHIHLPRSFNAASPDHCLEHFMHAFDVFTATKLDYVQDQWQKDHLPWLILHAKRFTQFLATRISMELVFRRDDTGNAEHDAARHQARDQFVACMLMLMYRALRKENGKIFSSCDYVTGQDDQKRFEKRLNQALERSQQNSSLKHKSALPQTRRTKSAIGHRRISSSSSPISPSFSSSPSSSSPGSILPKLNATQVYKLCGAAMCCLLTWDAAICGDGHEIKYNGTHLSLKDMFIVAVGKEWGEMSCVAAQKKGSRCSTSSRKEKDAG